MPWSHEQDEKKSELVEELVDPKKFVEKYVGTYDKEYGRKFCSALLKEDDRFNNRVRPNKKQHQICCWFYGKVEYKKVDCFAREKSRNIAKTKKDAALSGVILRKFKKHQTWSQDTELFVSALGLDEEWSMLKKTTHEGSHVLSRSWSKGSSTADKDGDSSLNLEDAIWVMLARNIDVDDGEYHVLFNKWLNLKNENLRLQHDLVQSREQEEKQSELVEELVGLKEKNESFKQEHIKRWSQEVRWEVRQDVRQGVQHEVLQRVAVSNKSKVVLQCANMKIRQELLKHGCTSDTRKEAGRCINNCVRPNKKQHRMCYWFCGKVGHKKVNCFAREKSRNIAKKVNKTFI
ncbi:hypothetical protein F2Q69_00015153 [Brassica cretica]|uniref:CCHC-type domain-containing protein n=1 Tax=Brassica cretica TaxID=69181 RepID=A0A8S9QKQ8_BRACR|nr:hypothetical protein F2Q69_00015153 [Brassica cretica]